MLRLRKFLGGDDFVILNIDPFQGEYKKRNEAGGDKYNGAYQIFDNKLIALFCFSGGLYLILDNHLYLIDDSTNIEYSSQNGLNKLRIIQSTRVDHIITYFDNSISVSTLWYSEDEEDANFGLWISNVISNKEKMSIFCEYNM